MKKFRKNLGPYIITFTKLDYENVTAKVLVNNLLNNASELNIEMRHKMEEFKNLPLEDIEANSSIENNFTGKFEILKQDFISMPVFKYHDYNEMVRYLYHYHEKYPNITWLYRIGPPNGRNSQSRLVFVIAARNPDRHELLRPEFKFVANNYGEDYIGRELLLLLIKSLLEKYEKKNKIVTELISNTRIHIVPSLDPAQFESDYREYEKKTVEERDKQSSEKVCILNDPKEDRIDLIFPGKILQMIKLFIYKIFLFSFLSSIR